MSTRKSLSKMLRNLAILFSSITVTALASTVACAQDTIFFPAAHHVAIRAMQSVPAVEADHMRLHTVVSATGSVTFAELESGAVTGPVHHHTREQVDVGLSGTADATLGTHVEKLRPGYGVIIPADVNHSFANRGPSPLTAIQ